MAEVSVVIPTWNRGPLLERAVRSVLAQTFRDLEVLVCDDGSDDDSRARLDALGDPRVRWLPGPRSGLPASVRNRGVRESRSPWLAFLDSDDEWLPGKLEAQLAAAVRTGCGAVTTNARRRLAGGAEGGFLIAWAKDRIGFRDLLRVNRVVHSSVLVRRELVVDCGGFPEGPEFVALDDYPLYLRIATRTDFAYLPEPLIHYSDEPAVSQRALLPAWRIQRRDVMADFLRWAGERRVAGERIGRFARSARAAYAANALKLFALRLLGRVPRK